MKTSTRPITAYAILLAGILFGLDAGRADADIIFEKVVDTDTPVPGGSGPFSLSYPPAIRDGRVVFTSNRFQQGGVYTYAGGQLSVVADTNTTVPGGTSSFWSFGASPSIDANGNVAFQAGVLGGVSGIYAQLGGTLGVVADTNTPIPGGTGAFTWFGGLSMDNGQVAFNGTGADRGGIYMASSGITVVADTDTPIPSGSGNFTSLTAPSLDSGQVAFHGSGANGQQGIYTDIGGLSVVADTTTPIPGGTGNFEELFEPSIDDGNVAFAGGNSLTGYPDYTRTGVYADIDGQLDVVADASMLVPDGSNPFLPVFGFPSLDDGRLAFFGGELTQIEPPYLFGLPGIYLRDGQSLIEIIGGEDTLDGKTVDMLLLGPGSLSGNQVAFYASFEEGGAGIYVATVPEPAAMMLLLLTVPVLLRRRGCSAQPA